MRAFGRYARALLAILLSAPLSRPLPASAASEVGAPFPAERAFPERPRQRMRIAGTGTRQRAKQDFYRVALYVDAKELAARAGKGPADADALADLLAGCRVSHGYVTRFLHGVGSEMRGAFLLENIRKYWPGTGFDPGRPGLRELRPFFERDLARGSTTEVWIGAPDTIVAREEGGPATRATDPELCRAFAASYLSREPMDPAVKKDLVAGLPSLLADVRAR